LPQDKKINKRFKVSKHERKRSRTFNNTRLSMNTTKQSYKDTYSKVHSQNFDAISCLVQSNEPLVTEVKNSNR
jgi:hypothetical protein